MESTFMNAATFTMGEISTSHTRVSSKIDAVCMYHTAELGLSKVCGTLPYGCANDIVRRMSNILAQTQFDVPVYAGVCGTDPTLLLDPFLKELKGRGVFGIQNFPTVAIETGYFRNNIESIDLGIEQEIKMLVTAQKAGFDIMPFVFSGGEAIEMSAISPRCVIVHPGIQKLIKYEEGATDEYLNSIQSIAEVLRRRNTAIRIFGFAESEKMFLQMIRLLPELGLDSVYSSRELWRGDG